MGFIPPPGPMAPPPQDMIMPIRGRGRGRPHRGSRGRGMGRGMNGPPPMGSMHHGSGSPPGRSAEMVSFKKLFLAYILIYFIFREMIGSQIRICELILLFNSILLFDFLFYITGLIWMVVSEVSHAFMHSNVCLFTSILLGNSDWKIMSSRSTRSSYRDHPYDRKTEYGHEAHHPY